MSDKSDSPITLLRRRDCHLCEVAREVVARVSRIASVRWVERDVDGDDELRYEYGDRVPVVLLRGREHSFWRVDEARLLADLTVGEP
ncbi:MAG: glutaredoxin family protein [Mycobacteriales bacterium]